MVHVAEDEIGLQARAECLERIAAVTFRATIFGLSTMTKLTPSFQSMAWYARDGLRVRLLASLSRMLVFRSSLNLQKFKWESVNVSDLIRLAP